MTWARLELFLRYLLFFLANTAFSVGGLVSAVALAGICFDRLGDNLWIGLVVGFWLAIASFVLGTVVTGKLISLVFPELRDLSSVR